MNRWLLVANLFAAGALLAAAQAEEVPLFQASQAGEQAWVWGGARAKSQGDKLLVTLHNKEGRAGDTYIASRFPYLPDAKVTLAVGAVARGDYTLQVLGFKNKVHLQTVEPIAHATAPGLKSFRLGDAGLSNGVDEVLLKLWVGGAPNAAITLDELAVSLPLDKTAVLLDERFQQMDSWTNESLVVRATAAGAALSLKPDTTFGAILLPQQFPIANGLLVLWNAGVIENGDATLQFVGFDQNGTYVQSLDGVRNVRGGWHALSLPRPGWPAAVRRFQIKLWVGGNPTAQARFGRLLVLKPAGP